MAAFAERYAHLYVGLHEFSVIQTQQTMRVIDQHVEMLRRITAKNSSNARLRSLYLARILDHRKCEGML